MMWGHGMGGWGMAFMTIGFLVFWGLVIAGIVLLARNAGRGTQTAPPADQLTTPQQVLAERYARGEIDEEEYVRRLRVLAGGPTNPRAG